jgi:hypothetical protein
MNFKLAILPVVALCTGCMENTMSGTGANSSGGTASGTISQRSDGNYALVVTVDGGVCSAVYSDPTPRGTELQPLVCSRGQGGNATVMYDSNGEPRSATYGGIDIGSGTVIF